MSGGTLGARVKAARAEAGLKMRDIEGVDSGALSRIESGQVADVKLSTLQAIAKATGRSLEELAEGTPASAVRMIALRDIEADPDNPRTVDVADTVDSEFVESIKEHGLLQAVTVRRMPADHPGTTWRIAFGGRRYAALTLIHGPKSKVLVPCLIKDAGGADLLLKQLVENVRRSDMNPWDLARAITSLVDQKMDTQAIAGALGRKRRWVQEMASVGRDLHNHGRVSLANGSLSISQAVAIAAEKDQDAQYDLVQRAIEEALNEDAIRAITANRKETAKAAQVDPQVDLEDFLNGGTKDDTNDPKPHSRLLKWKGAKGPIAVQVFKLPNAEEYTHGGESAWRPPGGVSWHWSALLVNHGRKDQRLRTWPTPWAALTAALVYGFDDALSYRATKQDEPLLKLFIPWAGNQFRLMGGPVDDIKKLQDDLTAMMAKAFHPEQAQPAAKAPPKPKAAPVPKPIDISEPPTWAQPIVDALFMYHTGRQAFLCKGWRHMAKTFSENLDADQEELRALYDRKSWANNLNGEPFDFGGAVVLLKDAPA